MLPPGGSETSLPPQAGLVPLGGDRDGPDEREFRGQARPNVYYEAGIADASWTRSDLVEVGNPKPLGTYELMKVPAEYDDLSDLKDEISSLSLRLRHS